MQVSEIWRFPVKSMGGESLLAAEVTELGIVGDRSWGLHDLATGTVLTARRTPELLFASARLVAGELVVTLPDGTEVGEGADGALSAWLRRDVELRPAGDDGGIYEAPLDAEHDADWVSWTGPGLAFHDSRWSRVSLVSTSTLGAWDRRRFRTNLIVDGEGEDAFVGRHLRVGSVELAVFKRIDRCVMVTRPQPGLERDLGVLRAINTDRDACLAIGALVAEPGELSLGSAVVPVATAR